MQNGIIEADFKVTQERSLPIIASEIQLIENQVAKTALEGAVLIGLRLQEAKDLVGHGNFEEWCKQNLDYSKSKAERFMKLGREYGDKNSPYAKTSTLTDFSISKALSLLAVPEEEVETFAAEHDIEAMSVRELEEEIKNLKNDLDAANKVAADADAAAKEAVKNQNIAEDAVAKVKAELAIARTEAQKQLEEERTKAFEQLEAEKAKSAELQEEVLKREREKGRADAAADLASDAEELKQLEEENERLHRQLENAKNSTIMKFKVLTDQLQDVAAQCRQCIKEETNPEQASKMKTALNVVLERCKEKNV